MYRLVIQYCSLNCNSSHMFCCCRCVLTTQNTYITCAHRIHTPFGIFTHAVVLQGIRDTYTACMHACMHKNILEPKRLRSTMLQHPHMHSKIKWGEINCLICQNRSRAAVVLQIALLHAALAAAARASHWTRLCTFPWWQDETGRWTHSPWFVVESFAHRRMAVMQSRMAVCAAFIRHVWLACAHSRFTRGEGWNQMKTRFRWPQVQIMLESSRQKVWAGKDI